MTVEAALVPRLLLPLIAVACYRFGAFGLAFGTYRGDPHHGRGSRIAGAAIAAVGALVHAVALVDERADLAAVAAAPGVDPAGRWAACARRTEGTKRWTALTPPR